MASIELIKASDGSGNANVATVQSSRSPLASTIIVDTVLGINPDGFAGTMGTPHTFTDPVTSETITIISEATAVDFTGHIDGSNIEIDDIAPGYTDLGSEIGDIVIIRPTTQYADNLAETLEVVHNDDGTLKDNVVNTADIVDDAVTAPKIVGLDKGNLTTDSNPYKFSAYATGNTTGIANANTTIALAGEEYDTNSNFASNTYTAPVDGYYHFAGSAQLTRGANTGFDNISLCVGGTVKKVSNRLQGGSGASLGFNFAADIFLTAGDLVTMRTFADGVNNTVVGAQSTVYFMGHLISRS